MVYSSMWYVNSVVCDNRLLGGINIISYTGCTLGNLLRDNSSEPAWRL